MKASTAIGIAAAFGGLLLGALMEGSAVGAFFNVPAALIVLGGTFGATLASTSIEAMKRIPGLYRTAFSAEKPDLTGRVELLVSLADRARRDGGVAVVGAREQLDDEFTRRGLQLVVDGTEPELVLQVMENEIDGTSARHAVGRSVFEKAGGFAPTMGIIGTVMGLVHVLENLDAPATLGPAISGAFIATLYGVASANVVFLPVGNRLRHISEAELALRELTIEGVLAIQAGDNPRIVADKLMAFVPPAEREAAQRAEERPWPAPEREPDPVRVPA